MMRHDAEALSPLRQTSLPGREARDENDTRHTQGSHPAHNIRDLDRDEGAALHAVLFDEQIEWAEPQREHATASCP